MARALLVAPLPEPLVLGAPKSTLAHSEAAAGMHTTLSALASLLVRCLVPVNHLRAMSEHVREALRAPPRRACAARGPGATATGRNLRVLVGGSSFGMAGTNAHVLMAADRPVTEDGQQVSCARRRAPWHRARFWLGPRAHPLALQTLSHTIGAAVTLQASLRGSNCPRLWHSSFLAGRGMVPASSLLETGWAALLSMLGALPRRPSAALTAISFPSTVDLPVALNPVVLHVHAHLPSGQVTISRSASDASVVLLAGECSAPRVRGHPFEL